MKKSKPRCGARRKYDGQPCEAQALASGRCKLHGGLSTGPRSLHGKITSLAHLRSFADCKVEILAVADTVEMGAVRADVFDRLIESESAYAGSAVRKIAAWMAEDLLQEPSIRIEARGRVVN